MKKLKYLIVILCCLGHYFVYAQSFHDCKSVLQNDTLILCNSKVKQKWLWNNGEIKAISLTDEVSGKTLKFSARQAFFVSRKNKFIKNEGFKISEKQKALLIPAHLEVELINKYQGLKVKEVFRLFPNVAAINRSISFQYDTLFLADGTVETSVDGTENFAFNNRAEMLVANYGLLHPHYSLKAVQFKDITDGTDNLVFETDFMPYRRNDKYKGNLLVATDNMLQQSFFLLKEAPNESSQVNYPGFDYAVSNKSIQVSLSGFNIYSGKQEWVQGYDFTIGVAEDVSKIETELKKYLKSSINYNSAAYDMVLMNTWGDRSADGRISEDFILKELDAAHEFGISHFQIDDGWMAGYSANSVNKSQNLWDIWKPEDWEINPERFPNGLEPIVQKAKELGIEPGLWFHPSNHNEYENWETDARVIINVFNKYGIKYIKIDGLKIPTNRATFNLGRFFEKVKKETGGEVFFNLDLTAGVRGGYFLFRYAGNLFVENRYTDWQNYYPYRTLRNLWMLSKYYPVQLLQTEFLNNYRNREKYGANNIFAPGNYNFEYLFATTMAGQPLAWFEATGLPKEAFAISGTVKKYREIQSDFHSGIISPIGDVPSGRSWSGFISERDENTGYLLLYRENNSDKQKDFFLKGIKEGNYKFENILGEGRIIKSTINVDKKVTVEISKENGFLMVKYKRL